MTKEKLEKLRPAARKVEADLMALLKKSPKELWDVDLDHFLKEWEVHYPNAYIIFDVSDTNFAGKL